MLAEKFSNGDISPYYRELFNKIKCFDFRYIDQFYIELINNGKLEMPHPDFEDLITYARSSLFKDCYNNVIFFSDEFGKNGWILYQAYNFIDGISTERYSYSVLDQEMYRNMQRSVVRALNGNQSLTKYFEKSNSFGGFIFGHERPAHFFYDQLANLVHLYPIIKRHGQKIILQGKSYVDPSFVESNHLDQVEADKFYFLPLSCTVMNFFPIRNRARYLDSFINRKLSPKYELKSELIIWIGVTGQKRSWVEQIEGYSQIINILSAQVKSLVVLFDGWTAEFDSYIKNQEDEEVVHLVTQKLSGNPVLINLIGQDYHTKIKFCRSAHVFISNAGTGSLVPLRFVGIPGVMHSNHVLYAFNDEYPDSVKLVSKEDIRELESVSDNRFSQFVSYSIKWEVVYNLLCDAIEYSKCGISLLKIGSDNKLCSTPKLEVYFNDFTLSGVKALNLPDFFRVHAEIFRDGSFFGSYLSYHFYFLACFIRPKGPHLKKSMEITRSELVGKCYSSYVETYNDFDLYSNLKHLRCQVDSSESREALLFSLINFFISLNWFMVAKFLCSSVKGKGMLSGRGLEEIIEIENNLDSAVKNGYAASSYSHRVSRYLYLIEFYIFSLKLNIKRLIGKHK